MTPGARLETAIVLLESIDATEAPADQAASGFLRRRRYIGAKDRRAILETVYGVIRNRMALDWWIARAGMAAPGARLRVLALLSLAGGEKGEDIAAKFSGARHAPAALTAQEREMIEKTGGLPLRHPDQPPRVAANCPDWIAPLMARRFGLGFLDEMAALNAEAPLDLRVNFLKGTREKAQAALAKAGIVAEPTRFSPWGLRLPSRRPVTGLAAYKSGLVEIQDEGSQLVAVLADAKPGQFVVDFCAGGGGKALAMAAAMRNRGEIAALDVSKRLDRAAPRIARAGAKIIRRCRIAASDPWLVEHTGTADRVLVDAPCSGTGAWRRDPMARFRFERAELARLVELQRKILSEAAALVRPGGRLIYATCSLIAEENEDQAAWFAERHGNFAPVAVAEIWDQTAPCPAEGPYLTLTPLRHGTDGFFAAVFERRQ
jgi:16S rRNA (cytosine967-C5)-methyltransferase